MPPPPAGLIKKNKRPQAKEDAARSPLVIASVVTGICIVGVLLAIWPDGDGRPNSTLEAFFKDNKISFTGSRVLCGSTCDLTATRPVQQGEPIVRIPAESIIDARRIFETSAAGKAIMHDNATVLRRIADADQQLGPAFTNLFTYAFYLALEKKDAYSKYASWFASLPTKDQLGGALFWDENMDQCVDAPSAGEAASLRAILAAAGSAAQEICSAEETKHACPNGVPTAEELQYAFGIYLSRNFQDQAILIGADFAPLSNARGGLQPQFSQEDSTLVMHSGDNFKKGEKIPINFARGPGTLLVSTGKFDPAVQGIDARIRSPDASKDPMMKKYCADKQAEMLFTAGGRPKEALVNCVGLLVADPDHRRKFKENMKKDERLLAFTWGNLTGVLAKSLQELQKFSTTLNEEENPQCKPDSTPLAATMKQYTDFVIKVTSANYEFASNKHKQYAHAVPPPATENGDSGSVEINPGAEEDAPETP